MRGFLILSGGLWFPFAMGLGCGAVPEAEAVVAGLQDVAVVGEPVEQCRGHLGIPEYRCPLTETEVGGDDHACLLVQLAEKVKQQGTPRGAERQVSQFVEDQQVGMEQTGGNLPAPSGGPISNFVRGVLWMEWKDPSIWP